MKLTINAILVFSVLFISNTSFAQLPGGLNKLKDAGNKVKSEKDKIEKTITSEPSSGGSSTPASGSTSSVKALTKAKAELYLSSTDVNTKSASFKEGDVVRAVIKTDKTIKSALLYDNQECQLVIYKDGEYLEMFRLNFVSSADYKTKKPMEKDAIEWKRIYVDEAVLTSDKLVFNLMAPQNQGTSVESYMLTKFFYEKGKNGKYKVQLQKPTYPESTILAVSEFDIEFTTTKNKLRSMLQSYKNYVTQSDFYVSSYNGTSKQELFKDGDEIKAIFKTEKTINDIFPTKETSSQLFTLRVLVDGKYVSDWDVQYLNAEEYAKKDVYEAKGKVLYNNKKEKIPYQYAIDSKRILYYKDTHKSSKELVMDLVASKEHATTYGAPLLTRSFLQTLTPGTHHVELQLVADRPNSFNEVCYYTEFDVDYSAGIDKTYAIYAPYDKLFQKSIADLVSKTTFPKAATTNATIEADFKALLKNEVGGEVTPIKVSLQFADWQIEKNKYSGLPLRRKMQACVAYKMKTEPSKTLYHYFWIVQEYEGAGKYGKSLIDGTQNFGDIVEYNANSL